MIYIKKSFSFDLLPCWERCVFCPVLPLKFADKFQAYDQQVWEGKILAFIKVKKLVAEFINLNKTRERNLKLSFVQQKKKISNIFKKG